jgi:hypothetical protein
VNNPKRLELELAEAMKPFVGRLFAESDTGIPLLLVSATLVAVKVEIVFQFVWIEPNGNQRVITASYTGIPEVAKLLAEMLIKPFS